MRSVVVTGAFGFAGANLVEQLVKNKYKVYAVGRRMPSAEDSGTIADPGFAKNCTHNDRLKDIPGIKRIFLEMEEYDRLPDFIDPGDSPDFFFHLAWGGMKPGAEKQQLFVEGALRAMAAAGEISSNIRFIGIGSQSEYGVVPHGIEITEDIPCNPITDYGKYKARAYSLLKEKSLELGMDFLWVRLFSLIGKYEPDSRMLPSLVRSLRSGNSMSLSSCTQYWDYLDALDAADAMIALAGKGCSGEVYNIAGNKPRILKEYVNETIREMQANPKLVFFGDDPSPYISLRPSIEKLVKDTGWSPKISFADSLKYYR
ncbi:MAG: NAD(P)-dependent oxidoreductase [Butyrivibrio sp.]|nr:NAD(P)-dependent oxidoreductase [Butyrivibrio sp.]